jgi:hypothetical protein
LNNPEYFLVDIFKELVDAAKVALNLPNLNYQFGYVDELKDTLIQWSKTEEFASKKYPLIWLRQPFRLRRNEPQGYYGTADNISFFIINEANKEQKAKDRVVANFKPVLYPIYREMLNQINNHPAIGLEYNRGHVLVDRYYWGDKQQEEITDVVDCIEVSELKLIIHDNQNC